MWQRTSPLSNETTSAVYWLIQKSYSTTANDHHHHTPKEDLIVTASAPLGGRTTATCTSPWYPSDQDVGNNIYWYLARHVDDWKMYLVHDDSWNMKLTSFHL